MTLADHLVDPTRLTGPEISDHLEHHWREMDRTRTNAERADTVVAGEDEFVMPATLLIAGADQYVAGLPHPQTVPSRILQKTIANRPHLSVPLGPKGLGITAQRLTTKVEQPLNAIMEGDEKTYGFQWSKMCALLAFHGFGVGISVIDPADWGKRPSPWESDDTKGDRSFKADYARDHAGRTPDHENYAGEDSTRSANAYELAMVVHRARNVPIRHRALSIHQCAPIFGPNLSVEGLIVSQEYSTNWLRRHYDFGDAGVATPTGGTAHGTSGTSSATGGRTLTLIEYWALDEDNIPYVSYCIKGQQVVEARWKGRGADYDGKLATLDLKERFNLDRLPIAWEFGLGNAAETDPDRRAMGLLDPLIQGWRSTRAKLTMMNLGLAFGSLPILIETPDGTAAVVGSVEDDDDPGTPDVAPLRITSARPGTKLEQLKIQPVSPELFRGIEIELLATMEETPGKSNKDQSGFSQSMAEAFEELGLTSVRESLGKLYEAHGSFVLEAGKRVPGIHRSKEHPRSGYPPIAVFRATDVPTSDNAGEDTHNEPMILEPDLIDETFTTVAKYSKSMSIPEKQQSMEEVERHLKTRRKHLEDSGDESPETTEMELMLEAIRTTEPYQQYAVKLMAQVQGAEELEEIMRGREEGIANQAGIGTGMAAGVMPMPPQGMLPPGPGVVPPEGHVTGMAPPSYGQSALAGIASGGSMAAPIANVVSAGGALPPDLPTPMASGGVI